MNNLVNSSPLRQSEKSKFDLRQLDCVFSLHDLQEPSADGEEANFLLSPLLKFSEADHRPLFFNKLFQDEERYLEDPSLAQLEPQTLPLLFGRSSQRAQKKREESKVSRKCFHEEALKDLLCGADKLVNLAAYVCQCAGLFPNYTLTLPADSPLAIFFSPTQGSSVKCTLTQLLTEILRYTFQNIHDAVIREEEPPPEPVSVLESKTESKYEPELESILSQETPMEVQTPVSRVESSDDFNNQSVIMSDIDSLSSSVKRRHKHWTEDEEKELNKVLQEAGTSKVPEEKWEELARRFDRTVCSLHAKAKLIYRKVTTQEKTIAHPKDEARTYCDMISQALNSVPEKRASKDYIIDVICERYAANPDDIEKAVTQCLAKKFERSQGVYILKDEVEVPLLKNSAKFSVKERLIYILGKLLPNKQGTLLQIKKLYEQEFKETLDTKISADSNQAVWEKTISKTLLKCAEFDKSRSKTTYAFKQNIVL